MTLGDPTDRVRIEFGAYATPLSHLVEGGVEVEQKMARHILDLRRHLAEQAEENKRLALIASNAGRIRVEQDIQRRLLVLRYAITESAMEFARDPTEVFSAAHRDSMEQFRQWKQEREDKENPTAKAIRLFAEAQHEYSKRLDKEARNQ